MSRLRNLVGQRFGRLVVLSQAPHVPSQRTRWHCRCDCGRLVVVAGHDLQGATKSCGCLHQEHLEGWGARLTTHGHHQSPEYRVWTAIKTRCTNPASRNYPHYGGRGITMCVAWATSFAQFYADMGPRPSPQHTIERRDNNGPYAPGNCVWATKAEQARNTRGVYHILMDGQELTLSEACAMLGIKRLLVSGRLRLGWPLIDALYAPAGTRRP